jgi:hypothetical protein
VRAAPDDRTRPLAGQLAVPGTGRRSPRRRTLSWGARRGRPGRWPRQESAPAPGHMPRAWSGIRRHGICCPRRPAPLAAVLAPLLVGLAVWLAGRPGSKNGVRKCKVAGPRCVIGRAGCGRDRAGRASSSPTPQRAPPARRRATPAPARRCPATWAPGGGQRPHRQGASTRTTRRGQLAERPEEQRRADHGHHEAEVLDRAEGQRPFQVVLEEREEDAVKAVTTPSARAR